MRPAGMSLGGAKGSHVTQQRESCLTPVHPSCSEPVPVPGTGTGKALGSGTQSKIYS